MGKLYSKCKEMFYPNQLRVGTPKGVESAVHSLHAYYQNENTKDKVILKINFKSTSKAISCPRDEVEKWNLFPTFSAKDILQLSLSLRYMNSTELLKAHCDLEMK